MASVIALSKPANVLSAALPGDSLDPVAGLVGVVFGWSVVVVVVAGAEGEVLARDGDVVAVPVGDWLALTDGVVALVADSGALVANGVGPEVVVVVDVPVA